MGVFDVATTEWAPRRLEPDPKVGFPVPVPTAPRFERREALAPTPSSRVDWAR